MRSIILAILLFLCHAGNATNYYFSASTGDDNRSATDAQNPATPWRTIQKLNAFFSSLQPGDSVLFNRGDVFTGKLIVSKSGTAAANIVLGAYGTGARPVFNGFASLTGFSLYAGKVWSQPLKSRLPAVLLMNGKQQALGRYPNAADAAGGFLFLETHAGLNTITDNDIPSTTNWTGAELVLRRNRWVIDRNPITAQSGGTFTFTTTSVSEPANNFGYFIQNHIRTLDKEGEWSFDEAQKKLFLYSSTNPAGSDVRASVVDTLLYINYQNFISITGLQFLGANENAILVTNAKGVFIADCDFSYAGLNAVLINNASNVTVEGCTVQNAVNNGINTLYSCRNIKVRNNTITNTALFPGLGKSGDLSYQAITVKGKNILVEGNRIDNTGYVPIRFEGDSVTVQNNYITNFCSLKDDGAGIYTWNAASNAVDNVYRVVKNNIVLNGIGAGAGTSRPAEAHAHGIYLDDNSANVTISGNTVANCAESGLYIHNSRSVTVLNNTFFNNERQVYFQHDNTSPLDPIRNVTMKGNVLYAKSSRQFLLYIKTIKDDVTSMGQYDGNYYCQPFSDKPSIYTSYQKAGYEFLQAYDLSTWQGAFGQDLHSKSAPAQIPPYKSNGLLSANGFPNAGFNTGLTPGKVYPYFYAGSYQLQWNSGGKLDGGCLQMTLDTTTDNRGFLIMDAGPVTAGKTYLLKFSLLGKSNNKSLSVFVRKTGSPYTRISEVNYVKVLNTRTENEVLFTATESSTSASLLFDVSDQATVWFDNIQFTEASVVKTVPDDYLRFDYNAAPADKTVALDAAYLDARRQALQGTVSLPSFSSAVLLKTALSEKKSQVIDFPQPGAKAATDSAFSLTATATSGLPVGYRLVSGPAKLDGNTLTLTGAGTVEIEASQPGDTVYEAAAPVSQRFDVTESSRRPQTISFALADSKVLGDAPFALTATASSGLDVSYRIVSGPATLAGNTVTLTGLGTVTIEASQDGDSSYEAAPPVLESVSVLSSTLARQSQTISFGTLSYKTYGAAPFALSATASSGLPVAYRVASGSATVAGNLVTITGVGAVVIEASQPGDAAYLPATNVLRGFTVGKMGQLISFPALDDAAFGDEPFELSATANSGLPVTYRIASGPAIVSGTMLTVTGAGTVVVEASQPGNAFYAAAVKVSKSFSVSGGAAAGKQSQAISFAPLAYMAYGDAPFTLKATASSGLPVAYHIVSGPATVAGSLVTLTGAGTVTIEASQAGDANYEMAPPVTQRFVIAKDDQTISFGTLAYKTYLSPAFVLSATATSGLPVSYRVVSGPVSLADNLVTITGVGAVIIEASQPGDGNNNPAAPVQRSFTVSKAGQTITFPTIGNRVADDLPLALAATASSGLPVSYRVVAGPATVAGNWLTLTGSGTVTVEASQPGSATYSAVAVKQSFNVAATSSQLQAVERAQLALQSPATATNSVVIYPNPVASTAAVRITAAQRIAGLVAVYDNSGRMVKQLGKLELEKGQSTVVGLDAQGLANGVYVLQVAAPGLVLAQKFQVVR